MTPAPDTHTVSTESVRTSWKRGSAKGRERTNHPLRLGAQLVDKVGGLLAVELPEDDVVDRHGEARGMQGEGGAEETGCGGWP